MVEKLRKFGQKFWQVKERMILFIMLVILGYQIYVVLNPEELEGLKLNKPVPIEQVQEDKKPGLAPPPWRLSPPATYADVHRRNPFWMHAKGGSGVSKGKVTQEDLGISILGFQEFGDTMRVRLKTASASKWYSESDKFEEFELLEIDQAEEKVVIYAESYRQSVDVYKNR